MMIKRPFLGELELQVMDLLWSSTPLNTKRVHAAIGERRGISPNTVQSTLERLFRKEFLAREKIGHAYVYRPRVGRDDLIGRVIGEVVETLGAGESEAVLAAFTDLAERADDETLNRLEAMIRARRTSQTGDGE
ncbi:MAG: penicillinase repressor [endosymbiont of Seepiophila jonesi]|uniref:Penicillinase repressor n=1 Tax=endosymbiont of Lamellibrachia luymesi TaxID=2200907 RepID=A0A370DXS3_9GAMM|nr:MAG: penicillinase repressor [endosymbiont of Seepiophila jonesi]RDH91071.1 MAG: penicillinase repressor [endosymbiont of Lamellibrachia luymesi]